MLMKQPRFYGKVSISFQSDIDIVLSERRVWVWNIFRDVW